MPELPQGSPETWKAWEDQIADTTGEHPDGQATGESLEQTASKPGFSNAEKLAALLTAASVGAGGAMAGERVLHRDDESNHSVEVAQNMSDALMDQLYAPGSGVDVYSGNVTLYPTELPSDKNTLLTAPSQGAEVVRPESVNMVGDYSITLVKPLVVHGPDGNEYYAGLVKPIEPYAKPTPVYVPAEIGGNGDAGQIKDRTAAAGSELTATIVKRSSDNEGEIMPVADLGDGKPVVIGYVDTSPPQS